MMKFYKIKIKLDSPTIIPERRIERGYKGCLDYIPSTTLRGALITSLYLNGNLKLDEAKELVKTFDLLVSNAYLFDEGKESHPSHPFMYECKVERERINFINEVVDELKRYENPRFKFRCSEGHLALKYIHPKTVIPLSDKRNMFRPSLVKVQCTISTAISKRRASSQSGMLYEYDYIVEGQRFWSFLGISEKLDKYIEEGLELKIGRGISRGFGKAHIDDLEELSLNSLTDTIKSKIDLQGVSILYSQSPLLDYDKTLMKYASYPRKIDLNHLLKICRFPFNDAGSISIVDVEGKPMIYGKTRVLHGGWDMHMNIKRPNFNDVISEGSIVVANINAKNDTPIALAILSIIGYPVELNDYIFTGLNILIPIQIHPLGGL
ncbi:MAG: hypothetical protein QXR39_06890 [Candidatus Methanomethylicia archaeon]